MGKQWAPNITAVQHVQEQVLDRFSDFFSEQIDANIAFLSSRILAWSVSFRCQVSTNRSLLISISWGMHKLFAQRRRMLC